MRVRTEDTRLMSRAFTLALSCCPPKPGSAADAVQPTAREMSVWVLKNMPLMFWSAPVV
jgi:hypothetical protein